MSDSRAPERPRLHDDLIVRRHRSGDDEWIVIHDETSGRVLRYAPVHFEVARLADGTRDAKGILLAARRAGITIEPGELDDFLAQLAEHGMLANETSEPAVRADDGRAELVDRPVVTLPDFAFACSGRGFCCSIFPSILFTEHEVARALVALPHEEHHFLPQRGIGPEGPYVPPLVDGRCNYLGRDGHCRIQASGGAGAKPAGCSIFPAVLTDDGEEIRVSASVECACVLDGIGREGPSGLVPEGATTRAQLHPATKIGSLPERVVVHGRSTALRSEVRDWSRRLSETVAEGDVAAALWAMADAMETGSLAESIAAFERAPPVRAGAVRPWLEDAANHLERWADAHGRIRSEHDLTNKALRWVARAARRSCERCEDESDLALPAIDPHAEAFYVRADAFAYRWVGALPLATAVRVRAIRVWLARAIGGLEDAPAATLPLVEVVFRAHGLDAFCHQRGASTS